MKEELCNCSCGTLPCDQLVSFPLPPPLNHSFLESGLGQQAGSYLGLNTLIKLVIFEAKCILVPLRPGTSHVPFLGAHRRNHNHHALGQEDAGKT